jgi:hypothetical protein
MTVGTYRPTFFYSETPPSLGLALKPDPILIKPKKGARHHKPRSKRK